MFSFRENNKQEKERINTLVELSKDMKNEEKKNNVKTVLIQLRGEDKATPPDEPQPQKIFFEQFLQDEEGKMAYQKFFEGKTNNLPDVFTRDDLISIQQAINSMKQEGKPIPELSGGRRRKRRTRRRRRRRKSMKKSRKSRKSRGRKRKSRRRTRRRRK